MKKQWTELVFILDRSGSMSGLEAETIDGYNGLLAKQKKEAGQAMLTTVLFDDRFQLLHDRVQLEEVMPITEREYYVRGSTALLDALGKTIQHVSGVHRSMKMEERPTRVLVVITTDGMENASSEYSVRTIRQLVEHQKKACDWEFLFLGANIDALEVAERVGIARERAVDFHSDREGTHLSYQVIHEAISSFRASQKIEDNWKKSIEKDYETRKKKKNGQ